MSQDIIEIKNDLKEIKGMLSNNYVQQTEYDSYKANVDRALVLARKSAFTKMITAVIITSVITSLVAYFFNDIISN
jgi:hypothetical protein